MFLTVIIPLPKIVFADNIKKLTDPSPILDNARIPDDRKGEFEASDILLGQPSPLETSEYLYGDISVAIILPESNGTIDPETEDWTQEEKDNVYAEIEEGLNWWIINKHPLAEFSFTVHQYELETSYEPITRWSSDPSCFNELMGQLGYTDEDLITNVRSFDNDLRNQDNTDWAFTIFVVDSSNDEDGMFPQGDYATSWLQGPYMTMTYDNNGWGIDAMDGICAHELAHIFGAGDEYFDFRRCTLRFGFLQVENQNNIKESPDPPCLSDVGCIMRGGMDGYTNNELCYYSQGQVGWRDLNANGIIDCIDAEYNPDSDSDGDEVVDYWDPDSDNDGICDPEESDPLCTGSDNCPVNYNPSQEDNYPPVGNGIGDDCDCEGNFDCDQDCDGFDAATFKTDFGRSIFVDPCNNGNPCNGDFDCDNDCDGTDAANFKSDFGRSQFSNPCPACTIGEWCNYPSP